MFFGLSPQLSIQLNAQGPPNGQPGKCYAKCLIPDVYETQTEQIEIKSAEVINRVAEPVYETVTQKILIQPASVKYVAVPATYETVTEQILVKEASSKVVITKGQYETFTNSDIYSGSVDGSSSSLGDILDPANNNSPNQYGSAYNPSTPGSISNINDPNSPYNPNSPYYGSKIKQAAAERSGSYGGSGGANAGVDDGFLLDANVGAILPYVIKEASVDIESIPFKYETVKEEILISPSYTQWVKKRTANCVSDNPEDCTTYCMEEVPAKYKTVTRQTNQGCPAGYYPGYVGNSSKASCIKVKWNPAKYGPRTVMTQAPTYTTVEIPAEYKTITRQVVKEPATYKKVIVPATYKTVKMRVRKGLYEAGMVHPTGTMLVGEGGVNNPIMGGTVVVNPMAGYPLDENYTAGDPAVGDIDHYRLNEGSGGVNVTGPNPQQGYWETFYTAGCPSSFTYDPVDNLCKTTETTTPEYQTVTRKVLVSAGGFTDWREIVCGSDMTSSMIRKVQEALKSRGYDPGPIDNQYGSQTKAALTKYQQDNGLPVGNMNYDTLRSLGVN